jgi:hypothetical protein
MSQRINLWYLLRDRRRAQYDAIVLRMSDAGLEVLIPDLGIEEVVSKDLSQTVETAQIKENPRRMEVRYKSPHHRQDYRPLDTIRVFVTATLRNSMPLYDVEYAHPLNMSTVEGLAPEAPPPEYPLLPASPDHAADLVD